MKKTTLYMTFALIALLSCTQENEKLLFKNKVNSGITFSNTLTSSIELNILNYLYYYNGAGVATGDFNNDGLLDIYFTSNQEADHFYINKGNLQFEEIAKDSGINNSKGWTTGVTTVDINNDGLLDIYVTKVSGHLKMTGHNLLYENQGIKNGNVFFKEKSKEYNLDYSGLYTQTTFFDYDQDGDLDAYLLGHSLFPNSNFGRGAKRNKKDSLNGDKLLENKGGKFYDATTSSAIYSSKLGYGLAISTSDLNYDGYPDIYISNDFFEDDYLYINQQNGTFKEIHSKKGALGHTSHFSMGNDIADINNDGLTDIVVVDMLPEDLNTLKTSGTEFNYPVFYNYLRQGYQPQYMQNTLHINMDNLTFAETAHFSGIASTDWSWSPLFADFDNDGNKDVFITNGILGATNDMDFINFISNDKIQKTLGENMTAVEMEFIKDIPKKPAKNYFYKGNGDATFSDVTAAWIKNQPNFSHGSAYADLDNDGDLDLIVNNTNEQAYLIENKSREILEKSNYIKIQFKGEAQNTFGIGAKIYIYSGEDFQFYENYPTRGFLSATAPEVHIGLGDKKIIDSIKIKWRHEKEEIKYTITANQTLVFDYKNAVESSHTKDNPSNINTKLTNVSSPIHFQHRDNTTVEFSRNPLVPYTTTNLSKVVAIGDINSDNRTDILTLGAKNQPTSYHLQQKNKTFVKDKLPKSAEHSLNEDIAAVIADINGNGFNDIIIVSGGNEIQKGPALSPRLYVNDGENFTYEDSAFSDIEINASGIQTVDLDNDGDLDISITSNVIPQEFGTSPSQYILRNDGHGNFENITKTYAPFLEKAGNITDLKWIDIDKNGFQDAIVTGHWMPVQIYLNDGEQLTLQKSKSLSSYTGWYNAIEITDFDNDGDMDIICGNWGLNTRLKAAPSTPIQLYIQDFNNNGKLDPIVTYYYKGEETTIATKDELAKQLPSINKKYLSYNAFAKAQFSQLLPTEKLAKASVKKVTELGSVYFENKGDLQFEKHLLPNDVQISSVHDIFIEDINKDGFKDAILVGNDYQISTQLGRLDGSKGTVLLNDQKGFFKTDTAYKLHIPGASRSIDTMHYDKRKYFVIGRNNLPPLFIAYRN